MEMENTYKYIVYQTVNLENNKIYIGIHKTCTPDIFDGYLGCGVYASQPSTYENAKTAFQFAVKKYGPKKFKRTTLQIFNTLEEACNLEAQLVDKEFLEREDVYNMIEGGFGGLEKPIKVFSYDINGNKCKTFNSFKEAAIILNCHESTISYAIKYKIFCQGFYWSTDCVKKLDLNLYRKPTNYGRKHVYIYSITGSFVQECASELEAAQILETDPSYIRRLCLTGNCFNNKYVTFEYDDDYSKARKKANELRAVYQYDANGIFIKAYSHQIDAEKMYPTCNISKSIRLKTPDELGYMWAVVKVKKFNCPSRHVRKVQKWTKDGEFVKEYSSITAAEKENGRGLWTVLHQNKQEYKNFIYVMI